MLLVVPTKRLPIFSQHSRSWQQNLYVYPVISRRSRGLSIGVNLNPDKACNFDCVYCCVDRSTLPTVRRVDLAVIRAELDAMLDLACSEGLFAQSPFDQTPADYRRLTDVAFSGNGEPTACAQFADACRLVADVLAGRNLTGVKIVVITNASLFHRPAVAQALAYLDAHNGEIWAKLDAGTEEYYRLIERTRVPFERVLRNILEAGRLRPLVIQSLFVKYRGAGPDQREIDAYVARLRDLWREGCRIKHVQVYSVARPTAQGGVEPLEAAELARIAARVREAGIPAEAY